MKTKSVNNQLSVGGENSIIHSLRIKYMNEWVMSKSRLKQQTKGGYEKINLVEWGKMEAYTQIIDDLTYLNNLNNYGN
jgi:hypothetical protein